MYDNDGNGSKQMPVRPDFNMEQANRMLKEYKGGHESLPVAQDVVDDFVAEYKGAKNTNVQYAFRDVQANKMALGYGPYEDNMKIVANMKPVATLEGNPFAKNPDKDFLNMGMEYFASIGNEVNSQDLGKVKLGEAGIRHLIARGITSRKASLLRAVKSVIENGKVIMTDENHKGHPYDTAIVAAVVEWEGRQFYMGVVVRQDNGVDNSYSFHDAVYIEKRRPSVSVQDAGDSINAELIRDGDDDLHVAIILSKLADYNTEFQETEKTEQFSLRTPAPDTPAFREWFAGSKVVNEDGTPKVMYHGTNANESFTVFDTYGGKFGLFGIGSYFTDDRSVAESYTSKGKGNNPRVYEVYLSIQNPLDMDAA